MLTATPLVTERVPLTTLLCLLFALLQEYLQLRVVNAALLDSTTTVDPFLSSPSPDCLTSGPSSPPYLFPLLVTAHFSPPPPSTATIPLLIIPPPLQKHVF